MPTLFGMTLDQIAKYEGGILQEVTMEGKSMVERIKLIDEHNEKEKKLLQH